MKDKFKQLENFIKANNQKYEREIENLTEDNSTLKKDLDEIRKTRKKLQDSKNSLSQQVKSLLNNFSILQEEHSSLMTEVKMLKVQMEGGVSEVSSSDSEDENGVETNEDLTMASGSISSAKQKPATTSLNSESDHSRRGQREMETTTPKSSQLHQARDINHKPGSRPRTRQHDSQPNQNRVDNKNGNLLFLCDSNGKYLRLNKLCPKHNVIYQWCPTMEDARSIIDEIDTHQNTPETILIHTGTNDLENNTDPKAMAQEIYRMLALTSSKFPNSRILYSTLLPRDDHLNTKVIDINRLIDQNTQSIKNVTLIHHANVLSTRESFLHDKKHLNRLGVSLFARGLTRAIYKGVNIRPSPTRMQRQAKGYNPKFNNLPHTSRNYSYGRPSNQSYIHNLICKQGCHF